MKKKISIRDVLKNNQGTTLVEMIVAFSLLLIFLTAAGNVLAGGIKLYYHVKSVTYAQEVADTIMEKIDGMVTGAEQTRSGKFVNITIGNGKYKLDKESTDWLEDANGRYVENEYLEFYDRTGSPVCIYRRIQDGKGRLAIQYYRVTSPNYDEVYWTFDEKMYMGYEVTGLKFEGEYIGLNDDYSVKYEKGLIKVTLKIKNAQTGYEYETQRVINCYNNPDVKSGAITEFEEYKDKQDDE